MTINITNWEVNKSKCATCPFNEVDGRYVNPALASRVQERCLTMGSQICHHPRTKGKKETHLCRGARDHQLTIFYRLGAIKEQSEAAWQEACIKTR